MCCAHTRSFYLLPFAFLFLLSINARGNNAAYHVHATGVNAAIAMLSVATGLNASLIMQPINVNTEHSDVILGGNIIASELHVRAGGKGEVISNNVVALGAADVRTEDGDMFIYYFAAAAGSSCMPACHALQEFEWPDDAVKQGCVYTPCKAAGRLEPEDLRNCHWRSLKPAIPFCMTNSTR